MKESTERPGDVGRRELLLSASALLTSTSVTAATQVRQGPVREPPCRGPIVRYAEGHAVVATTSGPVRGYLEDGVYTYKGIPYGATTGGQSRFQPPSPVKPWTEVRDSLLFGPACPVLPRTYDDRYAYLQGITVGERMDEDCLRVNVWTSGIKDQRKRPVLFWLHPGGFWTGSSSGHTSYEGANLARRGDAVVVSINHRVDALGFLNLMEYGERYAHSANVGLLDIVASLEWVRDNIAEFGGDPGNVTIFGQSGGGAKVNCLMGMPSARGLFHRAIAQSPQPFITDSWSIEDSARVASEIVKAVGLDRSRIALIHLLPRERLVSAALGVARKPSSRFEFMPVVDGQTLPAQPFASEAPTISSHVPLIVGSTERENGAVLWSTSPAHALTDDQMRDNVRAKYGTAADDVVAMFRKAYPRGTPGDLWNQIDQFTWRRNALLQAERKAALGGAPAYVYLFAWQTRVLDGLPRAFHGSELPFVFYNTDRCAPMTGGTDEARALAARVSDAWTQFARTGTPGHRGLPAWPAFTADRAPTMVFDNRCEVKFGHDAEARRLIESL